MGPKESSGATAVRSEVDLLVQQAYLVLARNLRQLDRPVYALWPVPEGPGLQQLPRKLGGALAALGSRVGLVEPRERWLTGGTGEQLSISTVDEAIDSLTPAWVPGSNVAAVIEEALLVARGRYACILLDLSGLDLVGAHEVALIPEVSTVLFVARGRIGEFALAKIRRRFPADRLLGAVFTDARPPKAVA